MGEFDTTSGLGATEKCGGDVFQGQFTGSGMGDQTDNSQGGWGAEGEQYAGGLQEAAGGEVTDNVDIGSINISS